MTVEITDVAIDEEKVVTIDAIDVSEEHMQRLERIRDDGGFERELQFCFDTKEQQASKYLSFFLHHQLATVGCETYGEALRAVIGTRTDLSGKYLVWE